MFDSPMLHIVRFCRPGRALRGHKAFPAAHVRPGLRSLALERLEDRTLLSVQALDTMSILGNTGEKPQSKVWQHGGSWYGAAADSVGTKVWRLNGTSWQEVLMLASGSYKADAKVSGDVVHILLEKDSRTKLASIEYVAGAWQPWSQRPGLTSIALPGSVETATIDIDTTGRMWLAYEDANAIQVMYSDAPYTSFSAPLVLASGVDDDDIAVVTALPGSQVGVLWSNQSTRRFGFRVHADGAAPDAWSADEVPASQSALDDVGAGMADDHLNVAVAADGTLYAAVKTSYNTAGQPSVALLVRRTNGTWDNLYAVDNSGTRPVVLINELAGKVLVAYTASNASGNILFRESSLSGIGFGPAQTLIGGVWNNVSSTKQSFTADAVFIASNAGVMGGARYITDAQPGLVVTAAAGLVTTEGGGEASFTVRLNTQPAADVLLDVASTDPSEGLASTSSLLFTPQNWNVPQQVVATGQDDDLADGDVAYAVNVGPSTSSDPNYHGLAAVAVPLTNMDNDGLAPGFYFSLVSDGAVGGLSVANEDIVADNGATYSLFFDGSDVGLASLVIDAFSIISANEILLSFTAPAAIAGIAGTVDDSDIVKFTATSLGPDTAGTFSLYFDGSDVGLTKSGEDIDAVHLLPDGKLLLSTLGPFSVPGASGQDEDLVLFTPVSLGDNTAGAWSLYFRGADVGLADSSGEDVDALALDAQGRLYLSTTGSFAVSGVSGKDEDVFVFEPASLGVPTSGTFQPALYYDGSTFGLGSNDLGAIDLVDSSGEAALSSLAAGAAARAALLPAPQEAPRAAASRKPPACTAAEAQALFAHQRLVDWLVDLDFLGAASKGRPLRSRGR